MVYYIASELQEKVSADHKAVIETHNLELRLDGALFDLLDPAVRRANKGKGGRHVGADLDALLRAAVAQHKALDANKKAPSDAVEKQNARNKADAPKDKPASAPAADKPPAEDVKPPVESAPPAAGKAKGATPKQAKTAKKEKASAVRKDSRYLRASREIIKQPAITAEALARKADMSKSTAGHCLEAWKAVVAVLTENGFCTLDQKTTGK